MLLSDEVDVDEELEVVLSDELVLDEELVSEFSGVTGFRS